MCESTLTKSLIAGAIMTVFTRRSYFIVIIEKQETEPGFSAEIIKNKEGIKVRSKAVVRKMVVPAAKSLGSKDGPLIPRNFCESVLCHVCFKVVK